MSTSGQKRSNLRSPVPCTVPGYAFRGSHAALSATMRMILSSGTPARRAMLYHESALAEWR